MANIRKLPCGKTYRVRSAVIKERTSEQSLKNLSKLSNRMPLCLTFQKKGWAYADCYRGNGWSIAYRVLDAQYIRTAQRRRRIFLVLCLTNERAGEILFKRESLRGNTPQSGTPRQSVTADVKGSVGADDREGTCLSFHLTQDPITSEKCTPCITSGNPISGQASVGVVVGYDGYNGIITGDKVVTLGTNCDRATGRQGVCYSIENHPNDSRVKIDDEGKVQALTGRMGTGGGNVPMVLEKKTADRCENPVICLQGNGIDRKDTAGCNGRGWNEDACYTLNTIDRHSVVYAIDRASFNQGKNAQYDFEITDSGVNSTIVAKGPSAVCYGINGDKAGTLDASYYKGCGMRLGVERDIVFVTAKTHYIVRRLTPTECARLQGFPDTWGNIQPKSEFTDEEYEFWLDVRNTHATINGKIVKDYTKKQMLTWYNKLWTDSAEYKMWGNGIALPCALYVMQGIAEILNENN